MKKTDNYLDRVPVINSKITWDTDEKGIVTLCIENKGIMKALTQILFGKPKKTYIHLDREGSAVWLLIDGKRDIAAIYAECRDLKGSYEDLAKYFQVLNSYGFIEYK